MLNIGEKIMNIKKLLITALPGLVDTFIAMYVGSLLNITFLEDL